MLPFGVTMPANVPQRSEIPEGLMNYPVLFSRLSNDTVVKIILLLMKLLSSSSENDRNSALRDKYRTGH
jgi:hypothetical protein